MILSQNEVNVRSLVSGQAHTVICYPGKYVCRWFYFAKTKRKENKTNSHRLEDLIHVQSFAATTAAAAAALWHSFVVVFAIFSFRFTDLWFLVFWREPKFCNRANLIEIESQQKKASNNTHCIWFTRYMRNIMCPYACTQFTIVCGI